MARRSSRPTFPAWLETFIHHPMLLKVVNEIFAFFGEPEGPFWSALPLWKTSFPESPKKELPPIFEDRVGKAGVDFFTKMCRVERAERAGAEALCKHAFVGDERSEVAWGRGKNRGKE